MTTNRTRIWLVSVLNFSQIWGWRSYFFPKSQAGHVLKMFLNFWEISAWRSYKLGSYIKKKVYAISQYKQRRSETARKELRLVFHFRENTGIIILKGKIGNLEERDRASVSQINAFDVRRRQYVWFIAVCLLFCVFFVSRLVLSFVLA